MAVAEPDTKRERVAEASINNHSLARRAELETVLSQWAADDS
jgi:hypothetical protein